MILLYMKHSVQDVSISVKGVGFVLNFTRYQFIEDFDGF